MWSVGCILAEFIRLKPLFMGKGEIDQIDKIYHVRICYIIFVYFF